MRRTEIAQLGRMDGFNAWLRVGGDDPPAVVAGTWLRRHVKRIRRLIDQRLYLWAFTEGWRSGQPTTTKEQ